MITIKQIDYELAKSAFQGISFDPEIRAKSVIYSYTEYTEDCKKEIIKKCLWSEQYKDIIQSVFDRYHELYCDWLRKKSRTMSSMITGRTNFPVSSNQKKMQYEQNALDRLFHITEEVEKRIRKRLKNQEIKKRVESGVYENEIIMEIPGFLTIINNKAMERVQILFKAKPDEETKKKLNLRAFRWSPRNKAWQRKNTPNGIWAAKFFMQDMGYDI
jgi:hypothetical protein